MQYAVVDIETTGQSNKVTEIAVYVYDSEAQKIVEEYSSLVNPECIIPPFITKLTGIDNDLVASSPRFFEIAKEVHRITENRVFVAHNVAFDYNVIRGEFKELGADYRRRKVCTVRLSRQIFPGLKSYSLGKLCDALNIPVHDRHRATGDAKATTILLEMLLNSDKQRVELVAQGKTKEGSLPPHLSRETFESLPDQTGVYFMHNEAGKVIYVGKSKEIRTRIASHFSDNSLRKLSFKNQIHDITYQTTGSEFLALLVEAAEIKNHFPEFNRAQKYSGTGYALYQYHDQKGVLRLDVVKNKKFLDKPIASFSNTTRAKTFLRELVETFKLCSKMTGLQTTTEACFDHQIGRCHGICVGKEAADSYNLRVIDAIESFTLLCGTYLVWLKGRNREEKAFIYIENGIYKGYGYIDQLNQLNTIDEVIETMTPQKHNAEIQHILNSQIQNIPSRNIVHLSTLV